MVVAGAVVTAGYTPYPPTFVMAFLTTISRLRRESATPLVRPLVQHGHSQLSGRNTSRRYKHSDYGTDNRSDGLDSRQLPELMGLQRSTAMTEQGSRPRTKEEERVAAILARREQEAARNPSREMEPRDSVAAFTKSLPGKAAAAFDRGDVTRSGSAGGSGYWISTRVWSVRCAS